MIAIPEHVTPVSHLMAPCTARWASTMWESAPLAIPAPRLGIREERGTSLGRVLAPRPGGACTHKLVKISV